MRKVLLFALRRDRGCMYLLLDDDAGEHMEGFDLVQESKELPLLEDVELALVAGGTGGS